MNTKLDLRTIYQNWEGYRCWTIFLTEGLGSCRLSIYSDAPEDAVISDLFIPENCRNQGLGREILESCEKFAKEQGCNSISLRSDNDDWIREWYKRLGFEVESSQVWLKKNI